ncbi:hypothetical protein B0H14DRAFT_3425934 [Mycena olivaceomarginata]|nr:hypothetical protein B0H14DRAFT_3425934 [Mycena olivaceomarginata]
MLRAAFKFSVIAFHRIFDQLSRNPESRSFEEVLFADLSPFLAKAQSSNVLAVDRSASRSRGLDVNASSSSRLQASSTGRFTYSLISPFAVSAGFSSSTSLRSEPSSSTPQDLSGKLLKSASSLQERAAPRLQDAPQDLSLKTRANTSRLKASSFGRFFFRFSFLALLGSFSALSLGRLTLCLHLLLGYPSFACRYSLFAALCAPERYVYSIPGDGWSLAPSSCSLVVGPGLTTRLYHFFISPFTIFFARIADSPRFVAFKDLSGRLLKTRQDLAPQDASILQDGSQELAPQAARQDLSGILLKTQDLKTRVKKGSCFKTLKARVKVSRFKTSISQGLKMRAKTSRPGELKTSVEDC